MKIVFVFVSLLFFPTALFATWSIILVDPATGEIGIAGASCTSNCYGIGKIIPGKGAIVVQAMSSSAARAKGLQMILSDFSPQEIVTALRDASFEPERQQYAVITLAHASTPMIYTGDSTKAFKGAVTAGGVSIQGNTLLNNDVIPKIFQAVEKGQQDRLALPEILMAALLAGAEAGGDSRCGEQTATSAFITVARPADKKPYLNLIIFGQRRGGPNAVTMLAHKYERWKSKRSMKM
jgi:uncharacterized Ntn-hydrolase superfamily protein